MYLYECKMLQLVTLTQVNMQKRGSIDRSNRIILLVALFVIIALSVLYFMKRSELHRVIKNSNSEKVSHSKCIFVFICQCYYRDYVDY